jgi:D-alanyl-D-alanine carboxypeptidase
LAAGVILRSEAVGVSVVVLQGGRTVSATGHGYADLESSTQVSTESRFHVGSISKVFTAAAVLRLAESGQLDLDDVVTRHVPELEDGEPAITLRHLLNHTSGLAGPEQVLAKFIDRRHLEFSRDQLLGLLLDEPRLAPPGTQYAYNNLGYVVLGIVIERVSGQSYQGYLQKAVLDPAAASSVLLCDSWRVIPNRARGYEIVDGVPLHHEPVNASLVFAAGGLCATAADVAGWLRALARGAVVSPETFAEMSAPGVLTDGSPLGYGYGLFVDASEGLLRLHHGGTVNGYAAHASHYPDLDITVVVLTNTRSLAARRLERKVPALMIDHLVPPAPEALAR